MVGLAASVRRGGTSMPCAWSLVAPESISRSKCQKLLVQYSALLAVQPAISDDEKAEILVRRSTLNACLGNTNESIEDAMFAAELCPSMAVVRDRVHTPSAPLTFGHPAWQAFYRVGVGHFLQHRFGVAANFFLKVRVLCSMPCMRSHDRMSLPGSREKQPQPPPAARPQAGN